MTEIKWSHGSNTENLKQTQHTSNNPYVIQDGIRENNEYSVIGRRNPLLNRINGHSNSGSSSSAGGGRDINYCEIYFLSPSKRRISSDNIHQQQYISGTPPPSLSSSATMATTTATNNHYHMKWPTVATQATILRDKMNSQSQTDAFFENSNNIFGFNTRQSYDATLDNLEIRSHYSDSAATTIPVIQQMASATRSRNNNVTFSNCLTPPLLHASTTTTTTTTGTAINTGDERMIHSNRGSLRRSKGRSIQSLCSCDAADSEIIPNPNRPLYQYNLDRKNKIHTYTCEQNAQILMRLEREKRKLSSRINFDKQGNETHDMINGSCEETPFDLSTVYHDNSISLESESTTDVDIIPPPPPPIANKNRKITEKITTNQIYQQQHQQQQQYQHQQQKLKQQKYQQQQDSINDYNSSITTSSIKDTESMLNDCTSTILNCANVSHLTGGNNNNGGGGGIATKPDLCNINKIEKLHRSNSNSKSRSNQENIPLSAPYPYIRDDTYIPCFKSKNEDSIYFYHEESPQYAPNFDNRPNSGKYNTIGPSSCYAKHLTPYYQQHNSCNLAHVNDKTSIATATATKPNKIKPETNLNHNSTTIGRYFSQSLSNFSLIGNGNGNGRNNDTNGNNGSGLPSRQLGQTIDDYHHWYHHNNHDLNNITTSSSSSTATATTTTKTSATTITPYTQFRTPTNNSLNCNNYGESTLIDSSYTPINSSMSGLKTKHHRHSHQQHNQEQQNHQQQLHTPTGTSGMPWKHRQCPSRGSSSSGTNSFRFDPSRHWLAVSSILLIVGAASVAVPMALRVAASAPFEERLRAATQLLDEVPLIDGHNDLPWNIRKFLHNKLNDFNFDEDLRNVMPWARSHWSHTDLQRLKKGRVSAQFWAAYVPCEAQHRDAVQLTLEQIDVIKRLTERYSPQLTTCTSASDIIEAHKNHQLCSLTGVEGGHSLGGSLAVLRTLYAIGVRYMTLTSTCHTPWADSSYADAPTYNVKHGGLTVFGKTIIREMNRLGMIVDLSHVSTGTMRDALATSEAPVIFSHSSAYELCNSSRNVQDDILQSVAKNGGIVMVNFYSKFLSCSENSTVHDAVAHINHIKRIAGIDHVGLGAGFDGINFTPKGLEDVSTYPTLFAELLGEGWSIEDLTKLAGQNFLRVMQEVEKVRDAKKIAGVRPYEDHPNFRTEDPYNCTSS